MVDGLLMDGVSKLDIFTETAIITSEHSARDFFYHYDERKLKGVFCLDLKNERIKKVTNQQEALDFYIKTPTKCNCGSGWDENGVCNSLK